MRLLVCVLFMGMLLCFPDTCTASARDALRIWGLDVVPSLFPYILLCRLSARYMMEDRIPAVVSVPVLGLLGGSPAGAAVLSAYASKLPFRMNTACALMAVSGGISPAFLLNTICRWGIGKETALSLLIIHWLSACLSSVVLIFIVRKDDYLLPSPAPSESKGDDPILQAIWAVLSIGACIVVFSVAGEWVSLMLKRMGCSVLPAVLHAALEMAGGIHKIALLEVSADLRFILISTAAGFSGISILLQNEQQLRICGIGIGRAASAAVLRCIFSVLLSALWVHARQA